MRAMTNKLLLAIVSCCLACAVMAEVPSGRKNKPRRKITKVVELDATLPVPDPLPQGLVPQPMLSPDMVLDQQGISAPVAPLTANSITGIDVSHYQGNINWKEVARSGQASYVYIKATEGANLVDNTYFTNLHGARRAGLKVGAYHFYSPTAPVEQQFRNMVSNVNLHDHDLIPIIDVEHRGRSSLMEFQMRLRNFLRLVENHYGVQPIIYTSHNFYNKYLSGTFSKYKYMIARYHPDVPVLVDNARFVMWQYTAKGRMRGISGDVDRSRFMGNYDLRDIQLPRRRR